MSRERVVVGTDDRGRPISRWDDTPAEAAPYGFMEPAYATTVERRQATPEELAASAARDMAPGYLGQIKKPPTGLFTTPELMRASRMRGTQRSHEVVAAARATPTQQEWNGHGPKFEEATMDEPPVVSHHSADYSGPITRGSPLTTLSDAAAIAHEKLAAVRDAEQAWEVAREALAAAMVECFAVIGSPATPEPEREPEAPDDEPEPAKALRQPGHHDSHPGQSAATAERAARVTEAVARHGGDRKAAAAELGMRPNAVAMVMKHADRRAEATA